MKNLIQNLLFYSLFGRDWGLGTGEAIGGFLDFPAIFIREF
jgi:hypothetical protein